MPRTKNRQPPTSSLSLADQSDSVAPRLWTVAALVAICLAVVYVPLLGAPFIYDDHATIENNSSIVSLFPVIGTREQPGPLRPVPDLPTSGRPLVNLSFALNYAFGGLKPAGYHAVSLVIHYCSALLLWSIVKRTLLLPYFARRFAESAGWLALAVSFL